MHVGYSKMKHMAHQYLCLKFEFFFKFYFEFKYCIPFTTFNRAVQKQFFFQFKKNIYVCKEKLIFIDWVSNVHVLWTKDSYSNLLRCIETHKIHGIVVHLSVVIIEVATILHGTSKPGRIRPYHLKQINTGLSNFFLDVYTCKSETTLYYLF